MPIRPFPSIPQDLREWSRYFADVAVVPDNESVGEEQLIDGEVTNAKLRNSAGTSVIGRAAGGAGVPADIVATNNGEYLRRNGGTLGFGAILDADIPATIARDAEVTAAVTAHEAAANPHPGYLTAAEGDAAYAALSHTHAAADVVSGTFADARIAESSVTQWEASFAITESQITDLGHYPERDQAATISGVWEFEGNVGFFGETAVAQQTTPSALSLATVSGSGADTDINNNFTAIQSAVNALKTALDNLGLTG